MAHFDETSGVVSCKTDWGRWWQTMEDVCIEVDLEEGTTAKFVQCQIKTKSIKVVVKGQTIIQVCMSQKCLFKLDCVMSNCFPLFQNRQK